LDGDAARTVGCRCLARPADYFFSGAVKSRVPGRNCDQANQNSGMRMSGFNCVPFIGPATLSPYGFHVECVSISTTDVASAFAGGNRSALPFACASNAVVVSAEGW